jgi:hypothetical protein
MIRKHRALPVEVTMARMSLTKTVGGAACIAGLLAACPPAPRAQELQERVGADEARGDEDGHASRFGRMFRLPPFAEPTPAIKAALVRLGMRGGLLDARDHLAAGPINLIIDPLLNLNNPNNDEQTAGVTFVGQFLDHDMTFDTSSRLGRPTSPRRSPNARRPFFDLDSVYGDGPAGSPQLFDTADRAKLRIESGGLFEDLPRHRAAPS